MQLKKVNLLLCFLLFSANSYAQNIEQFFSVDSISKEELAEMKSEFGNRKTVIKKYETQILIALSHFPELKNIEIEFRLKSTKTPLASKPIFGSLFRSAKKRKYLVILSEETNANLEPILFKNLNFNAQIGVLGHELSHISDYSNKGFGKMFHIICIEMFSKKQVDAFEYNTDLACINHGLGYQLLDWSKFVRQALKRKNWRGTNNIGYDSDKERYLNPESIINCINQSPLYKVKLTNNQ